MLLYRAVLFCLYRIWFLCSRHCEPDGCIENICQKAWPRYGHKVIILVTYLFNLSWLLQIKCMMIASRLLLGTVSITFLAEEILNLCTIWWFHVWIFQLGLVKSILFLASLIPAYGFFFWHVGMHAYFLIPNFYSAIPWKLLENERSWKML